MADGEAFRQRVADVLKAAGIAVEIEAIVCGKRIDIVATTSILGRDRCYAIECKASDSNIGMDTVSADAVVYNDIASNQTSGIDEAWIVGSRMFTPQARDHASNLKRVELLTYDDLMARLFDVRPYMMSLRDRHEVELSNSLYVPLRSDNGQMLDQVVKDWIDAPDRAAMAIIAGYGRGKTTFADRIAGELAAIALSDNAARVPVLLKLSEISQEARLSGLVLSTLAGPHIAQRVSFEFFTKLNGFGRFVVIADGFDEMKYGLNFEEFEFLFNQIRALVVDGAKVLLLGRPSAFLSESEELAVLSLPESEPALVSPEAVELFEKISSGQH